MLGRTVRQGFLARTRYFRRIKLLPLPRILGLIALPIILFVVQPSLAEGPSTSLTLPQRKIHGVNPEIFSPGQDVIIVVSGFDNYPNMSVTFNGEPGTRVSMESGNVHVTAPSDLPNNSPIVITLSGPIQPVSYTAHTKFDPTFLFITFALLVVAAIAGGFYFKSGQIATLRSKLDQNQALLDQTRFDFTKISTGRNNIGAVAVPKIPSVPPELLEACVAHSVILVSGTGMSIQAGWPSWKEILAQLISKASETTDTSWAENALAQIAKGRYEFALNAVRSRSDLKKLTMWLQEVFYRKTEQQDATVKAFRPIPLAGAIACSFDDTVELILKEQNMFSREELIRFDTTTNISHIELLHENTPFLFQPFGDLRNPSSLLFSERELRDCIDQKQELRRFIASLFATKCFFLVGMSASAAFELVSAFGIREKGNQRHFALVPYEDGIDIIGLYPVRLTPA